MKRFHVRALSLLTLAAAATAAGCSAGDGATGTLRQADTSGHPARLYLTDAVLSRLQARAAANDAGWTALKAHCDGLTGGTFNPPSGDAYPSFPVVGQGYQGDGYMPEILSLGLCYRVTLSTDAASAARYAAAGDRLLQAMSTPVGSGGEAPSTDDGYGMRNYGVGMATGFDWLYPALSAGTRQQVIASLNTWVDWYDTKGFSNGEPIGNYFAGYLLAKTATAIATDGDNPNAAAYWSDVQTRMYGQLVKPAFTASMRGGGWPEGWEYGPKSVEELGQFFWAVKTGKGLDWWSEVPIAKDEASYIAYFAWPSLQHMDDQGTIHAQARLSPPASSVAVLSGLLAYNGDAYAPTARSIAADLLATTGESMPAWQAFLYWDGSLATAPYTAQPLSTFAAGPNHVAARSTWQKDAVWGAFVAGTYIDAPDSGEQFFNEGGVTVVQGDQPILVNATGWLPQVGGSAGEQLVYDDVWTNRTRKLANTFNVAGAIQDGMDPSQAKTHVEQYEEGGAFVHARGVGIGGMYTGGAVSQFTRDFAYVRPGTFVVYDRTTTNASDQWMSWHTPSQPSSASTADGTQRRYDIAGAGGTIGSIRTLLPKNASTQVVTVQSPVYRLEAHASGASQDWLTVITAGGQVPEQVRLSADDGNVASGGVVGVHVLGARNAVVLFNADHAAASKTTGAKYTVSQTADSDHVLFDVAPSASGYAVHVTKSGTAFTVEVVPGGSFQPSAQGTLAFVVAADGSVQGMAPPPAPQPTPTPTPAPGPTPGPTPTPAPSGSGTANPSSDQWRTGDTGELAPPGQTVVRAAGR